MLTQTKGIFLHQIKYSETSIIAKIYTREFGLKAFILKGAKGKKASIKANILQPLYPLNLITDVRPKSTLHYIKELSLQTQFDFTPSDIAKTTISIFLSEVFLKTIQEEEKNTSLYDFMENSIITLSTNKTGMGIYHLIVLIQLSNYLGFSINEYILTGLLKEEIGSISKEAEDFILKYDKVPLTIGNEFTYHKTTRNEVLDILVKFYELHLLKYGDIKSHKILEAIM